MRKSILTLAAAFLLSSSAPMLLGLHAQEAQSSSPAGQPQASGPTATTTTSTFMGKITKKDEQYMLEDEVHKATYKLDDATKADKFEGKNVKVLGTLDTSSNMIHVEAIEESGS